VHGVRPDGEEDGALLDGLLAGGVVVDGREVGVAVAREVGLRLCERARDPDVGELVVTIVRLELVEERLAREVMEKPEMGRKPELLVEYLPSS
jgi:hypothetical protein